MKHAMRKLSVVVVGAAVLLCAMAILAPTSLRAQDFAGFEQRMTEFTLDNGLKFLVLELKSRALPVWPISLSTWPSRELRR
ncbi:MAG: hypothetical protein ACYSU5_16425 [Planctomycetota bacterium]|jgi:hypothetical protein